MLSLRPVQAMVLFVLAVLLICAVGSYADDRIETDDGRWMNNKVYWDIATGHHSWNSYNTHSWHRVFVRNDSTERNLTVTFWWEHDVIKIGANTDATREDNSSGSFSVPKRSGVQEEGRERIGWLGPNVSGWLVAGNYKLISRTKVQIKNDKKPRPQTSETEMVTKTTRFTISE